MSGCLHLPPVFSCETWKYRVKINRLCSVIQSGSQFSELGGRENKHISLSLISLAEIGGFSPRSSPRFSTGVQGVHRAQDS